MTLTVKTPDGEVRCSTHQPVGTGPWPAVLMFQDAFGVRPAAETMAAHLAAAGFFVLLPNLLYRSGEVAPFNAKTVWGDEPERTRLMKIVGAAVNPVPAMRDVGLYLAALEALPEVKKGGVGVVGYCMGGTLGLRAAAAWPEKIAAVASIHGGNLVTDKPDSPHLGLPQVKARLYFACADNDRSCTPEQREALTQACQSAHVRAQVELYPGKAHGFAVPDMPVFDAEACELHWERVTALFSETLG